MKFVTQGVSPRASLAQNIRSGLKARVRDGLGASLFASGLTQPAHRLSDRLSIVTFHRVLPQKLREQYALPGLVVTPEELDDYLAFLTKYFHCTTLDESLHLWASGSNKPLLAVTFDDGQADNFRYAKPVLDRHGVRASFYIPSHVLESSTPLWHDQLAILLSGYRSAQVSSNQRELQQLLEASGLSLEVNESHASSVEIALERSKSWSPEQRADFISRATSLADSAQVRARDSDWDAFMSIAELKELLSLGHELGGHSHSHALLPQLSDAELEFEIIESKERTERALGTRLLSFCYPNGDHDERVRAVVKRAGYRAAVTTSFGSNGRSRDLFSLRRCDMHQAHLCDRRGDFSASRLAWRLSGLHPGLRMKED